VAQGIIARPRLLILDEPSGGLAPLVVDRILDVARALTQDGVAVLLSNNWSRRRLPTRIAAI
jgi:branched-chain amino acid transport system ATP-binding protein